jgi:hypothetical protein
LPWILLSLCALSIGGRSLAAPWLKTDLNHATRSELAAKPKVAAYDQDYDNDHVANSSARLVPSPLIVLPAGQTVTRRYTICNDRLKGARLQVRIQPTLRPKREKTRPLPVITRIVAVSPGGRVMLPVDISLPSVPVDTLLELTVSVTKNGKEQFRKNNDFLVVPQGPTGTQAQFLDRDDRTRGNWQGRYGKQAFFLPIRTGIASFCDSGIFINRGLQVERQSNGILDEAPQPQGAFEMLDTTWTVDDPRIPLAGSGLTTREPIAFSTPRSVIPVIVRIEAKDGKPHRLSFYFVDYKRKGRPMNIELYDRQGYLLAAHRLSNYGNGAYLRFHFTGSVVALIRSITNENPTLSGIFVDPETGQAGAAH